MKKTFPCNFPIVTKDHVVRCWNCVNCKKFMKYLKNAIKKNRDKNEVQVENIRYYFTNQPELWSK